MTRMSSRARGETCGPGVLGLEAWRAVEVEWEVGFTSRGS